KFNVLLVSDEVYADYVFEGRHISLLHVSGWEDVGIYVNSFSKTFAMTGWRLGYLIANPKLVALLRSFAANIYTSPTSFVQIAATKAIEIYDDIRQMILTVFHERKSFVEKLSQQTLGLRPVRLEGGMFAFIMLSKEILEKVGSSDEYADYLLEKAHIALTPGTIFSEAYGRQALRLSLAARIEAIKEAFRRLEEANKALLEL
ncbi:MAG TPA: pyridoxal phosphate-dependent aminotransferase, partial [Pyrodictium sp.]|nr:pyridoxal phosphate-dependent aminotransferase [Pyrodictium sp.]